MTKTAGVLRSAALLGLTAGAGVAGVVTGASPALAAAPAQGVPAPLAQAAQAPVAAQAVCPQQSLLPAYFYPGATWQAALSTAAAGASIIVNPSSGPGSTFDPNYAQVIDAARAKGAHLWGYIDTKYTTVPISSLQTQIADYSAWYGITDVFFDDVSSSAADLGYYQSASQAVRTATPGASVMLNPGDYPDASYATLGDVINVFEGNYQSYLAVQPPAWAAAQPAGMLASMVSAVPDAQMPSVLALSRQRGTGYIYVTDHVDIATLYEQLPAYWDSELQNVTASCTTTPPPTGGTTPPPTGGTTPPPAGPATPPPTGGTTPPSSGPAAPPATAAPSGGYWMTTADGAVYGFDAPVLGSVAGVHLAKPVVGISSTADGGGYRLVAADGGVFTFGDASFYGSLGNQRLSSPVVGAGASG